MPARRFNPVRVSVGSSRTSRSYGLDSELRRQLDLLTRNIINFVDHMEVESPTILKEALQPTFLLSQSYTPVRTGALKKSGYLETQSNGRKIEVEMGYGRNGHPDYAAIVHEIFRSHKPPTRWKFLQQALLEDGNNIQERIINGYKQASGV